MALAPKRTGFTRKGFGAELFQGINLAGRNLPAKVTFTFAQNATQYGTECEIAVCDSDGKPIPAVHHLDVYLTDSAVGAGVTGTDPNGTVTAKTSSGVLIATHTAKKTFRVQTLATGKFTLQILDDATPVLLYVAAVVAPGSQIWVSRKTVAGDYKP